MRQHDWLPLALIAVLALAAFAFVPSTPTWLTLTIAGLAMGMMIFMMASGLTLVFGLMDVMNFAHGAFISVGAYAAASVLIQLKGGMQAPSLAENLMAMAPALAAAVAVAGLLGWIFERVVIRPVYGDHLKQILVTMGGLIVVEQLIHVVWGPDMIPLPRPATITGSVLIGDAAIERYRMLAVLVGLAVFAAMWLVLNRTRLGLLIRAGVENTEMVESLGYRVRRLFVGVFVAGSALAGLGGVMWAMYQESVTAGMGMQMMVVIFIVIIIGGMGSVGGCFVGALLVGLMANYIGYLAPKLALGSNILLMVLILLWRPRGLYPASKARAGSFPAICRAAASSPRCWYSLLLAFSPRRFSFPARARSTSPRRWRCSCCWWRATTCCWATPGSCRSRTPCSSASAATASASPRPSWGRRGAISRSASSPRSRSPQWWRWSSACCRCACGRCSSP